MLPGPPACSIERPRGQRVFRRSEHLLAVDSRMTHSCTALKKAQCRGRAIHAGSAPLARTSGGRLGLPPYRGSMATMDAGATVAACSPGGVIRNCAGPLAAATIAVAREAPLLVADTRTGRFRGSCSPSRCVAGSGEGEETLEWGWPAGPSLLRGSDSASVQALISGFQLSSVHTGVKWFACDESGRRPVRPLGVPSGIARWIMTGTLGRTFGGCEAYGSP